MHGTETGMGGGLARGVKERVIADLPAPEAGRSVEPSTYVLFHSPADSRAANTQHSSENYGRQPPAERLGCGLQNGDPKSSPTDRTSPQKGELGLRVEAENDRLANTREGSLELQSLRPSQVVRLLNSTPLGPVLNDRQMYRHRQRAPWIQNGDNRINLVAYCAWLIDYSRTRRKPRKRRVRGRETLSLEDLRELLRRQNYRCALTGEQLTPSNFALDHIVPLASGGDFSAGNSQLVLKVVNRAKNTLSEHEFIEMCRKVAWHRSAETLK